MSFSEQSKILIGTGVLLLIPLIAMQFTDDVYWTLSDFIIAAILLISAALIAKYAQKKIANSKSRYCVYVLLLIAFLLLWAELAVGIFD